MPAIFKARSRRDFLKVTSGVGAAVVVQNFPKVKAATQEKSLHLALLSDTHVPGDRANEYRGFRPWESLKRIVPEITERKPEGVIINGDAARLEGLREDYVELKELLKPVAEIAPVYIALGNHDDRVQFNAVFSGAREGQQAVPEKHVLVLEHEVVSVVVLDSLMYVNKVPGLLGKAQREWLGKYLTGNPKKPVVLFLHHTLDDNDGALLDAPRLFELLRGYSQVKAIFYGHSHTWKIEQREQLQLINLPAVAYNFRDQEPVGWVEARFRAEGVDLTLRASGGNTTENGVTKRVQWL
jgi:3',5'-cyclic-AMP phosphodiesterase